MDLINREDAIKFFQLYFGRVQHAAVAVRMLEELDTIDAVPVVRCKECKHANMTYDGLCKYCNVLTAAGFDDAVYFEGDHYCSDGERKDGDE